ncbi:uncharacterized protein V1518DRAFT_419500 [Limtongia smithiae]|uniref:uncharacterized protein n=1 Tax=Limtongia smithiae TaxID=1125753 RepID=UPI0034CEFC9A
MAQQVIYTGQISTMVNFFSEEMLHEVTSGLHPRPFAGLFDTIAIHCRSRVRHSSGAELKRMMESSDNLVKFAFLTLFSSTTSQPVNRDLMTNCMNLLEEVKPAQIIELAESNALRLAELVKAENAMADKPQDIEAPLNLVLISVKSVNDLCRISDIVSAIMSSQVREHGRMHLCSVLETIGFGDVDLSSYSGEVNAFLVLLQRWMRQEDAVRNDETDDGSAPVATSSHNESEDNKKLLRSGLVATLEVTDATGSTLDAQAAGSQEEEHTQDVVQESSISDTVGATTEEESAQELKMDVDESQLASSSGTTLNETLAIDQELDYHPIDDDSVSMETGDIKSSQSYETSPEISNTASSSQPKAKFQNKAHRRGPKRSEIIENNDDETDVDEDIQDDYGFVRIAPRPRSSSFVIITPIVSSSGLPVLGTFSGTPDKKTSSRRRSKATVLPIKEEVIVLDTKTSRSSPWPPSQEPDSRRRGRSRKPNASKELIPPIINSVNDNVESVEPVALVKASKRLSFGVIGESSNKRARTISVTANSEEATSISGSPPKRARTPLTASPSPKQRSKQTVENSSASRTRARSITTAETVSPTKSRSKKAAPVENPADLALQPSQRQRQILPKSQTAHVAVTAPRSDPPSTVYLISQLEEVQMAMNEDVIENMTLLERGRINDMLLKMMIRMNENMYTTAIPSSFGN